jgi:hypothetical protein
MRVECGLAALLLCGACGPFEPGHDSKVPGDLLGTYSVTGRLARDDCGAELLGAPNPWRFDLKLSRFERDLYWLNGREAIVGDIEKNGTSFSFDTHVDVTIRPASANGRGGCVVSRRDRASGSLITDGDTVSGLTAELDFQYSPKNNDECVEIIGLPGGVEQLPCRLGYDLSGQLTVAGD